MARDSFFMEERSWWYPPAEKPEELLPPSSAADRYSHAPTPVLLLKFSQPLLKWPSSSSLLSYLLK